MLDLEVIEIKIKEGLNTIFTEDPDYNKGSTNILLSFGLCLKTEMGYPGHPIEISDPKLIDETDTKELTEYLVHRIETLFSTVSVEIIDKLDFHYKIIDKDSILNKESFDEILELLNLVPGEV